MSMRAQQATANFLTHGITTNKAGKTTDDLTGAQNSVDTTNASQAFNDYSMNKTSKFGLESMGPLQLPKIGERNQSPFKGFIDISLVTQKMRKGISTQAAGRIRGGKNPNVPMSLGMSQDKMAKEGNVMSSTGDEYREMVQMKASTRGGPRPNEKKGSQMNSKVLETWINETLTDADHLDIPGVILKPEHKLPI